MAGRCRSRGQWAGLGRLPARGTQAALEGRRRRAACYALPAKPDIPPRFTRLTMMEPRKHAPSSPWELSRRPLASMRPPPPLGAIMIRAWPGLH